MVIAMGRPATAPQPAGMRALPLRIRVETAFSVDEYLFWETGNRCHGTAEVVPDPEL